MRSRPRRQQEDVSPVNATPLIDVVLCMIVFFLLVGRLAQTQRIPMRLPESASGSPDMPRDSFVINVVPEGGSPASPTGAGVRILVNDQVVGLDAVAPALAAHLVTHPAVTVQIRAPRDVAYGVVEPILEACASVGVADVRLATDRSGAGAAPVGGSGGSSGGGGGGR